MIGILVSFILSIILLIPRPADAQAWQEDGRSCFCLKHETGQMIKNCNGVKPPTDAYVTATCRGGEKGDQLTILPVKPPWVAIKSGDASCNSCQGSQRETKTVPRGDGTPSVHTNER
jgi:hypothetical protein